MRKNLPLLLNVTLVICLIIFSCKKKDEPEPTATTTTGTSTTGGTTTGTGTTGGSTTGTVAPAYTKVKVTGFRIDYLADLDPPLGWDPNDGPDVYYIVYKDETNNQIMLDGFADCRYDVVSTDFPLMFNFSNPYSITNLESTWFHLGIYDHDGSSRQTLGGSSFMFKGSSFANYPTYVDKDYGKCKVRIFIQWFN